jgi:hypothetical protein
VKIKSILINLGETCKLCTILDESLPICSKFCIVDFLPSKPNAFKIYTVELLTKHERKNNNNHHTEKRGNQNFTVSYEFLLARSLQARSQRKPLISHSHNHPWPKEEVACTEYGDTRRSSKPPRRGGPA